MICERCKKNEASIFIKQDINGIEQETRLCAECAEEMGLLKQETFAAPFNWQSGLMNSLMNSFFGAKTVSPAKHKKESSVCDSCGTSINELMNTAFFGCPDCYESFSDVLNQVFKRIQAGTRHVGRKPGSLEKEVRMDISGKKFGTAENEESDAYVIDTEAGAEEKTNAAEPKKTEGCSAAERIEKLRKEQKQAVSEENYEEAARIRDEIKKLSGEKG